MSTWRNYKIGALGHVEIFYAPDLETAFVLARAQWPSAKQWTCYGKA